MANFLVALCCLSSIFQAVILSSVNGISKGIGDLTLQLVNEAIDNQNMGTEEIPDTIENYNEMDYKIAMGLALDDADDRHVKLNVHGKLVPLPTRSLNDSSAEELAKALNLDLGYRVHLYASDHFRYSILMTLLKFPICCDFVDISNARPHEIARLPLELFNPLSIAKFCKSKGLERFWEYFLQGTIQLLFIYQMVHYSDQALTLQEDWKGLTLDKRLVNSVPQRCKEIAK